MCRRNSNFREWTAVIMLVFLVFVVLPFLVLLISNLRNIDNLINILNNISVEPEYFSGVLTAFSIVFGFFTVFIRLGDEAFREVFLGNIILFCLSIIIFYYNVIGWTSDFYTLFFMVFSFLLNLFLFILYYVTWI